MVASRWPWRLDFLAAAIKRSVSAVVRYSRVRTEEFTVVGADRPPLRFPTIFCPRSKTTDELSNKCQSEWYPWPTPARSEPTCTASASQLRTLNRLRAEALGDLAIGIDANLSGQKDGPVWSRI